MTNNEPLAGAYARIAEEINVQLQLTPDNMLDGTGVEAIIETGGYGRIPQLVRAKAIEYGIEA